MPPMKCKSFNEIDGNYLEDNDVIEPNQGEQDNDEE